MTKPSLTVTHVAPAFYPEKGGVETHVLEVSKELLKRGYQVNVITTTTNAALSKKETYKDITIYRSLLPKPSLLQNASHIFHSIPVINTLTQFLVKLEHKLLLWRLMLEHQQILLSSKIIQVHDVYWWLLPLLPFLFYKTYLTFHGWEGQFPVRWQAKLQRWVWSKLAVKTVHVGAWIQEFYWDKPTAITYGGVNATNADTARSNKSDIVFLGRLVAENDIQLYIDTVAQLRHILPTLTVTWVGDGPYRDACAQVGEVVGMVKHPEKYTSQADVVCASSYLAMLEAQSAGKVVAAAYSHQLKERYLETYPGNPYILKSNDPTELAQKIRSVMNDSDRRKELGNAAYQWARTQTWAAVADTYEQLWQNK